MKEVVLNKPFNTEEEYFAFEEKSELKHEYINSTLFEMSGVSKYHNSVVINLVMLLKPLLKNTTMELFVDSFKVKTPDGNFFYPDIILSEPASKKYYTEKPVMIAEVLSGSTRIFELTDKLILYRKFPTLQYYLCIEPEQVMVHLYYRTDGEDYLTDDGGNTEWQAALYTDIKDIITLPKLGISISLQDIYQG